MLNENILAESAYKVLHDRIFPDTHTFRSTLRIFEELFEENTETDYTCVIAQEVSTDSEYPYHIDVARCVGWKAQWEVSPSTLNVSLRYRQLKDWHWIEPVVMGICKEPTVSRGLFQEISASELFRRYADCASDRIKTEFQGAANFEALGKWFPDAMLESGILDGCAEVEIETIRRVFRSEY